jgi:hypothetical protein
VIPAWLTNKEYVLRPEAVEAVGVPFLEMLNRGMINIKDLMASGVNVTRESVVREVRGPVRRFAEGGFTGGGTPVGASGGIAVTVPVNVTAGGGVNANALAADLQDGVERTVIRILKEHM